MTNMTAIVPVRRYDKLLKDRNLLPFGNGSLLSHKLSQLKEVSAIEEILVTSDCPVARDTARAVGVSFNERPAEHATEFSRFNDFVRYIAEQCSAAHLIWCPVTCPLVLPADYDAAISMYYSSINLGYDSLITAVKEKRYLLDDSGPLSFRFDINKRNKDRLPTFYEYVNAISIAPTASMIEWGYNWGNFPVKYLLPASKRVDICDADDYFVARALYEAQQTETE